MGGKTGTHDQIPVVVHVILKPCEQPMGSQFAAHVPVAHTLS
jgi:hypothetical protein